MAVAPSGPNSSVPLPEASRLWECFDYNLFKGILIWKTDPPRGPKRKGAPAGSIKGTHIRIQLDGNGYYASRLIHKWFNKSDPKGIIEHLDDNGFNNQIWNLEDSNQRENARTMVRLLNGKVKGCYKQKKRFGSYINIEGRLYWLGSFSTEQEGTQAYEDAVNEINTNPQWKPNLK